MLRYVAHVRTDVSEERSTCITRVTRIGELDTLAVTSNQPMLQRNTMCRSQCSRPRILCACFSILWVHWFEDFAVYVSCYAGTIAEV
jgi:hypothetical protein